MCTGAVLHLVPPYITIRFHFSDATSDLNDALIECINANV